MPSARRLVPALPALPLAAAVVALAGCGSSGPATDSPFPLQLRLSGGLTARDDRLVVQADGTAAGTVRPAASGTGPAAALTCTVDGSFLADLSAAASADLTPGATVPAAAGGDQDVVTVTGPGGAAYGIGEPAPTVVGLARRLIDDAALPPAGRALCR